MERNIYKIGKELFITSDEEIKDGDWFIHSSHGTTTLLKCKSTNSKEIIDNEDKSCWLEYSHKIILTTDDDLINDGVQAIDDEFLEWFVNNPICESVEVEIICGVCGAEGKEDEIDVCGRSKECVRGWVSDKYKIIIPRKIIQIYKINDLKEAFLKGYVAKNNKEDYPFAVQKFLNSKLNENKK